MLGALYFAQGLPFGFFTQALPVVLRRSGYSLVAISASGVLFAPWALKFLWAPYVDRYGSRRRWLLSLQLGAAAVALVLACLDLTSGLQWLFVGIAVVNVLSATQDVVTDGLAVRLLDARDRGVGNGIQLGAYRIGMIVGGGVLLWLFSFAGWRALFVAMAALIVASTIPVLLLRTQLDRADVRPAESTTAVRLAGTWWVRLRRPGVLAFIGLIAAYKFGNSMGSALVGPFLSDVGLSSDRSRFSKAESPRAPRSPVPYWVLGTRRASADDVPCSSPASRKPWRSASTSPRHSTSAGLPSW